MLSTSKKLSLSLFSVSTFAFSGCALSDNEINAQIPSIAAIGGLDLSMFT